MIVAQSPRQAQYYIDEGFYYIGKVQDRLLFTTREEELDIIRSASSTLDQDFEIICICYPSLESDLKMIVTQRLLQQENPGPAAG